jgi:hypothetical protein
MVSLNLTASKSDTAIVRRRLYLVTRLLRHNRSKLIIAMATVDSSNPMDMHVSRVSFFKFRILEMVSEGGKVGCRSRNCSLRLSFSSDLLTK